MRADWWPHFVATEVSFFWLVQTAILVCMLRDELSLRVSRRQEEGRRDVCVCVCAGLLACEHPPDVQFRPLAARRTNDDIFVPTRSKSAALLLLFSLQHAASRLGVAANGY